MTTNKEAENFAALGKTRLSRDEGRSWVERAQFKRQDKAVIEHVAAFHYDVASKAEMSCKCGYTVQELCDRMNFSNPSLSDFRYNTAYRNYPRLMKAFPHLRHTNYNRMIVSFRDPLFILTHFGVTGTLWEPEFDNILCERFRGTYFSDSAAQAFASTPPASRSGMLNRWKQNWSIRHLVEALLVHELMAT